MSERSKLLWRCRRGVKELDVIFTRFVEAEYDDLGDAQRAAFHRLIEYEDPMILRFVLGQDVAEDKEVAEIVTQMCSSS